MECNVSDLVKRGHDKAAQLKSSGGAVSQLISDLAAQLDVQLVRSNALAAESAGLKAAIDATIGWQQSTEPENVESVRMLVDVKTPATDAFLAEVRAQGVEMLTSKLQSLIDEGNFEGDEIGVIAGAVYTGADIAAQLRKGVQS